MHIVSPNPNSFLNIAEWYPNPWRKYCRQRSYQASVYGTSLKKQKNIFQQILFSVFSVLIYLGCRNMETFWYWSILHSNGIYFCRIWVIQNLVRSDKSENYRALFCLLTWYDCKHKTPEVCDDSFPGPSSMENPFSR